MLSKKIVFKAHYFCFTNSNHQKMVHTCILHFPAKFEVKIWRGKN